VVFRFRNGATLCRNNDFWTVDGEVESAEFAYETAPLASNRMGIACSYFLQSPHPGKAGEFSLKYGRPLTGLCTFVFEMSRIMLFDPMRMRFSSQEESWGKLDRANAPAEPVGEAFSGCTREDKFSGARGCIRACPLLRP